ncbi:MAG: hypothetical protein FJ261_14085 [Planctomycetes bacterium]|nr:hypothetical protein [Planctomycetota bacterium]
MPIFNNFQKLASILGLLVLLANTAHAQNKGLAAKYPKDVGIGREKAVLFHDDFEDGKVGAAWDEVTRRKGRGATDATEPLEAETDKDIARGALAPSVISRSLILCHPRPIGGSGKPPAMPRLSPTPRFRP